MLEFHEIFHSYFASYFAFHVSPGFLILGPNAYSFVTLNRYNTKAQARRRMEEHAQEMDRVNNELEPSRECRNNYGINPGYQCKDGYSAYCGF